MAVQLIRMVDALKAIFSEQSDPYACMLLSHRLLCMTAGLAIGVGTLKMAEDALACWLLNNPMRLLV